MCLFGGVVLCLIGFTPQLHADDLRVAIGVSDRLSRPADTTDAAGAQPVANPLSSASQDLAREICRRIGGRRMIERTLFAKILSGIEAQKFELGFGRFLRSPGRDRRFAFSDPIGRSSSRLLATPTVARQHFPVSLD